MGAAVVTGSANGLGKEVARRLVARGHDVWVTDVDGAAAEATAAELGARAHELQVADADACRAVADAAVAACGSLDVWVNNAGILRTGPAWELDAPTRRLMFDVNAHGVMNGTFAALEHMRPADRGHVVNVVSLAGLVAAPSEAIYAATKHAALAFGLGLQSDLRLAGVHGVHISSLCPDGMWTPMLFDKVEDPSAAPSWSGVMLLPEEVADAAVALLDAPRPVRSVPAWRGGFLRIADAFPRASARILPLMMADARRKQRRFAGRLRGSRYDRAR